MDFFYIMGGIILAGLGTTVFFFRRGGIYNREPMKPKDFTELDYLPASEEEKPEVSIVATTLDTETPTEANKPTLEAFALAIRDFEGKPGDQNYRLNNPGNARYNPSGYMPMYGKVGRSKNGFAVFSSYELGWKYLINMLKGQIHKRPNQTLLQFMQRYAPESDDNPTVAYATFIAKRLSTTTSFRMGDLVLS